MNIQSKGCTARTGNCYLFFNSEQLLSFEPFCWWHPWFVGHASFLLDELLYSIGPDDGSDQVALVCAGILLLHRLLSSARIAELVELHDS